MLKKLLILLISFVLYFFSPSVARSADEFLIDSTVEYKVEVSGKTSVRHLVSLENAFSTLYAKEYSLVLEGIDIASPQVFSNGQPLKFDLKRDDDKVTLQIFFDSPVVGKGKAQNFEIVYDNFSFAQKTGEVWEISIPKIGDAKSFRNYTAKLIVPNAIGAEAYVSPKPLQTLAEGEARVYIFDKQRIIKTGVTAGFGEFQVFAFNLNYHLENPLIKNAVSQVALPPDTAFQRVYYERINPAPERVFLDPDGNWIAEFKLGPREKIDIVASGAVQIFATERHFPRFNGEYLNETMKESDYWQTSEPRVKSLANQLRTAKNIYEYVWSNLTYDYERVKPNVQRLGAKGALEAPANAICTEYTDLFVALARAAGIPAREVNGYAYTENPKIQPLSLVSDVLHAWAEYWDEARGIWVPVDPTWASTTGGVDYFNKLDLRHFTFVIHGTDPEKPYPAGSYKLGANPQKDVFVSFGEVPVAFSEEVVIEVRNPRPLFPFNSRLSVRIKNTGSVAHYNLTPVVSFDSLAYQTESIEVLPPYGVYEFEFKVPFSFFGNKTPDTILVSVLNQEVSVPSFKSWVIIYSLLILFFILAIIVLAVLVSLGKINLGNLKQKIYGIFRRHPNTTPKF